jgi:CheY-like chemotaxis protein
MGPHGLYYPDIAYPLRHCTDMRIKQTFKADTRGDTMDAENRIRILLIEDNSDDVHLICQFLTADRNMHIDVERADSLSSAIEHLAGGQYDVILSDLGLPDSFGLDTLDKVHSVCSNVPIIVLTGLDDETSALEAVHRGAQDYIIKSQINGRNLIRIIRYAIERQDLMAQLKKSLQKIKVLQGILPICSSCKKIRDDKGSWKQMESYISDHSEAEFSHGYCPECAQKAMEEVKQFKERHSGKQ